MVELKSLNEKVEYVRLGDVCILNRYKQLGAEELKSLKTNNGDIHLLPSSRNFDWITNKQLAGNLICKGEVFTLGRARYANPKYVNGYFISSNNIIIESKNREKISTKYLYYFVISNEKRIYVETSTYPKFDEPSFNMLKIPLPPLRVQEEIVKILDKFTDLENELENELRMRKMQFNTYRDKLLTFDNGVKFEKLGDLCEIETGKLNANQSVSNGTYKFFTTSKKISKINTYRWNCEAILLPGNANLENIHYYRGKFNAYQRVYVIHEFSDKINPKFLYHMLLSNFKKYLKGNTNEATILYVVIDTVKKYYFPVPPLEKQKEIVEKLDKFNDMCNEISDGLPLEIELRKKQYEFYRDELLSFDKKAS